MRERPILFSGPMVRALLAGRKTQTRRVVRPQPEPCSYADGYAIAGQRIEGNPAVLAQCPYGAPGDALWVRETWRALERAEDAVDGIRFAADGAFVPIEPTAAAAERWMDAYDNGSHGERWRPSIFMPRWASRLSLRVTDVRVERLQEISEEDATAEGIERVDFHEYLDRKCRNGGLPSGIAMPAPYARDFGKLWDTINGKRAPWASNPWVWVVSFASEEETPAGIPETGPVPSIERNEAPGGDASADRRAGESAS
jgi:hypothetical protein